MTTRIALALSLLAALPLAAAQAQAPPEAAPEKPADPFDFPAPPASAVETTPEAVAREIARLDGAEFAEREDATARLFAMGESARPALTAAQADGDPETRRRAARVLAWLDRAAALKPFDVKVMVRGYCHVDTDQPDAAALGGFGRSQNSSLQAPADVGGKPGAVSLVARPDHLTACGRYRGMQLWVVNRTGATQAFAAQDSRINIVAEAQDTDGQWKPIEYLPSSW